MYFTREAQVEPEEADVSRSSNTATATGTQANEHDEGVFSHAFSASPGGPPGDGGRRLLRSPALASRSNTAVRVVALSRAQQTQGNRYTQRLVSQIQLNSKSQVVQRECACGSTCSKCSGASIQSVTSTITPEVPQRLVQAQATGSSNGNGHRQEPVIPEAGGEPMPEATREQMEARFNADFTDVRIHRDQAAAISAEALNANAYTSGRDIYFAAGKYAPGTPQGDRLLAHELTHTLQQSEGQLPATGSQTTGGIVVGNANDPLEHEADRAADSAVAGSSAPAISASPSPQVVQRDLREGISTVGSAIGGAASWGWNQTGGRVVRGVEALVEDTIDSVRAYLERKAPTLMAFLRSDPIELIKTKLGDALDKTFGGIFSRIQRDGLWGALTGLASEGFEALASVVASAAADPCGALRSLIQAFIDFQKWEASALWWLLKKGASAVAAIFSALWNDLAVPAWDAIKKVAGTVWQWIQDRAKEFWDWIKPLRELGMRIWNKVKQIVGATWDSGVDLFDWLKAKATAAWERIKTAIQPFIGPLKIIGGILLMLSPLGPIILIGAAGYGLFQAAKWLYNNWDKLDIVIKARAILQQQIIPWIQSSIASLSAALKNAAKWLQEKAQALRETLAQLAEALGVNSFLSWAKSVLEVIRGKVNAFTDWVVGGFKALVEAFTPIFTKLRNFFQPILVVLLKLSLAIANPIVWPIYIGAVIWMILPDCIKPPLIDYLMDIMIAGIRAIPTWGFFGEEWPQIKERIAKGLEDKRKAPMEEKLRFSNKIANMIAGPDLTGFSNLFEAARQSPNYFIGQVEQELIGMDLTQPLPLEQLPATGEGAFAQQATASVDAGGLSPEDAALLQRTVFRDGDVAADSVPTEEVPPEFFNSFQLNADGTLSFADNPNPTITNESIRAEVAGAAPAAVGPGAEAGGPAQAAMDRPPADLSPEDQIRWFVSRQPPVGCNVQPQPSEGKAQQNTPGVKIFPPLTQSQRALFMWEQMKRGLGQWYECHKTAIIASLITAAVVLVVLIILTDGVILEILPEILQVVAAFFIGLSVIRMSMFIADYVFQAISGKIVEAAKSLARGLAIGAIELLMYLLTAGSGKGAQKAGQRAAQGLTESAAAAGKRTARPFAEAAADAGRRFLVNIRNPVGAVVRNGKIFINGLKRGFARGVSSLKELGERLLQRLGFRRFSITLEGRVLVIWGHFNTGMPILKIDLSALLREIRLAAGGESQAEHMFKNMLLFDPKAARALTTRAGGVIAATERDLWALSGTRGIRLPEELMGRMVLPSPAIRQVLEETERIAAQLGVPPHVLASVTGQRALYEAASHAERQLSIAGRATALGVFPRDVCPDCVHFLNELARSTQRQFVIAGPSQLYIFLADGSRFVAPLREVRPILNNQAALEKYILKLITGQP